MSTSQLRAMTVSLCCSRIVLSFEAPSSVSGPFLFVYYNLSAAATQRGRRIRAIFWKNSSEKRQRPQLARTTSSANALKRQKNLSPFALQGKEDAHANVLFFTIVNLYR
jgi:hypothetical protein